MQNQLKPKYPNNNNNNNNNNNVISIAINGDLLIVRTRNHIKKTNKLNIPLQNGN